MGATMGKRMTTTPRRIPTSEKPAHDRDIVLQKRHPDRTAKPPISPVEPNDWRGEGVVGDNHTD
jgi:hypothetical protein